MACKPTYKGIRYNSLEELYNANGVNIQKAQQLYSSYLQTTNIPTIERFKEFVKDFSSPNSSLNNLDVETKERLIEKGWTQEKFNSVSQEEREQAIRCA